MMARFFAAPPTLLLMLVCGSLTPGVHSSNSDVTGVPEGADNLAALGAPEKAFKDKEEQNHRTLMVSSPGWTYQEPPWWSVINAEFTGVNLRRCFKREFPPTVGDLCATSAKTCFFGNQDCPGVGPYPQTKCFCDGNGSPGTWSCTSEPCPGTYGPPSPPIDLELSTTPSEVPSMTPSVTPSEVPSTVPSITTPTFTDQCANVANTCDWTDWLDRDDPTVTGDYELLTAFALRDIYPCGLGIQPLAIECQAFESSNGASIFPLLDAFDTGETIVCDRCVGFSCINSQQPEGFCKYDYRVRFQCPCDLSPPSAAPSTSQQPSTSEQPSSKTPCTAEIVGDFYISECEEKVVCEEYDGQYEYKPYREREEITCMAEDRRRRFIETYKAVEGAGHLDVLFKLHSPGPSVGALHSTPYFLPWHRWFIKALEDILRDPTKGGDCKVTVPWWRSEMQSGIWWYDDVPPFHKSEQWMGTDDAPNQCVRDGPFRDSATIPWTRSPCLKRKFSNSAMPTDIIVVKALNEKTWKKFSSYLQGSFHNGIHNQIGGTMRGVTSATAPEFFLHHAHVDKIWDDWTTAPLPGFNLPYPAIWAEDLPKKMPQTLDSPPPTTKDQLDLKKSGVAYVEIQSAQNGPNDLPPQCTWVDGIATVTSRRQLRHLQEILPSRRIFDINTVEGGLLQLAQNGSVLSIPQRPLTVETIEEMKSGFFFTSGQAAGLPDEVLEEELVRMRDATIAENALLLNPTEVFDDDASTMLGFDVSVVIDVLKLCPIGSTRVAGTTDRCSPISPNNQSIIDWTLGNSTVFLGNVVDNDVLETTPVLTPSPSTAPSGGLIVDSTSPSLSPPIPPGNYTVVETNIPGFVDVTDSDGGDSNMISVDIPISANITTFGGEVTDDTDDSVIGVVVPLNLTGGDFPDGLP